MESLVEWVVRHVLALFASAATGFACLVALLGALAAVRFVHEGAACFHEMRLYYARKNASALPRAATAA